MIFNACESYVPFRNSCFELLGFDILIDKKFKPYLLEVNHAPSFNDDTDVDKRVKTDLITDTLRLLNITYANKQKIVEAHRKALEGNSTNVLQKKALMEEAATA